MRAIAIEGFGGRGRLTLVDLPIPEPGPDDVLVWGRVGGVGPGRRGRPVGREDEGRTLRHAQPDRRRLARANGRSA